MYGLNLLILIGGIGAVARMGAGQPLGLVLALPLVGLLVWQLLQWRAGRMERLMRRHLEVMKRLKGQENQPDEKVVMVSFDPDKMVVEEAGFVRRYRPAAPAQRPVAGLKDVTPAVPVVAKNLTYIQKLIDIPAVLPGWLRGRARG
jgi:hypothetical protein